MLEPFVIFVVAAIASILLTPLVIRFAGAWGLYDTPHGDRRVHTQPLPRVGGVAVFASMLVAVLVIIAASVAGLDLMDGSPAFLFGILFGGAINFATGFIDDLRGLRPLTKVVAQVLAALVVYAYGFRIDVLSFGSASEISLEWLALPVTVFWIVAVTNAFNLIDGLDGLASGIAIVALATTVGVAFTLGNPAVVVLSAALLGALVGFFRYNSSPARIFLGDSGSLFIGFMLAVLSVYGSYKSATATLMIIPLAALAIPLLDTSLAVLRRWLRGVPLSQADGRHIHHRLLAAGLTHRNAVIVLHILAVVIALLGISIVFAPPPAITSIAVAGGTGILMVLLYGLRRLQYHEFVEAGAVLMSGFLRLRRIIRNQITAQDIAGILSRADATDELNLVLEEHAGLFGFLHMEVCRESAQKPRPLVLVNGEVTRAWKLDYPVMSHDFSDGDDYVLRIWCNPYLRSGPDGAERVARVIAPVLTERLLELGSSERPLRTPSVFPAADSEDGVVARESAITGRIQAATRVGSSGVRPSA